MKFKTIIMIAFPILILGTIILLSNMDFGYSVIEEDLYVQGIITEVYDKYIVLENGKEYRTDEVIKYNTTIKGLEVDKNLQVGNYLIGLYDRTSSVNILAELNVNIVPIFSGVIEELDGNNAIVVPDESERYIISAADRVYVALPYDIEFNVGDKVTVEYDGELRESYPLQIVTRVVNGHYVV